MNVKETLKEYATSFALAASLFVFVQLNLALSQHIGSQIGSRPLAAWFVNGIVGVIMPGLLALWYNDNYQKMVVAVVSYFVIAYVLLWQSGVRMIP